MNKRQTSTIIAKIPAAIAIFNQWLESPVKDLTYQIIYSNK
ncbi:hypothetical protein [Dolichospermum flos-aquae]|nr:hypothetical protein [Dolichospermum flos-aquae]